MIDYERIMRFLKVSSIINSALEPDEVIRRTIEYTPEVFDSEAASLLLLDSEANELYFNVATGEKGEKVKEIRLKVGQGVAGWVAEHREPLIVNDTSKDERFFKKADEKSGFITKNILCVPVLLKEELTGVLEVLNKKTGDYTEEDLTLLKAMADQVAVALENARLYKELKETFYSTVETLAEMIELRDPYTGGHTQRVKEYSLIIGRRLGLDKDTLERLQLAAVLH
ncbi:MAG: GAF domain-containing protein, partial [Nitrospirae bacterium]